MHTHTHTNTNTHTCTHKHTHTHTQTHTCTHAHTHTRTYTQVQQKEPACCVHACRKGLVQRPGRHAAFTRAAKGSYKGLVQRPGRKGLVQKACAKGSCKGLVQRARAKGSCKGLVQRPGRRWRYRNQALGSCTAAETSAACTPTLLASTRSVIGRRDYARTATCFTPTTNPTHLE